MFEAMTYLQLQQYWWIIISVLAALLVFLMFVQGGQTMIYTLGKTDTQRSLVVNALGHKWELTFTTLVTFGGAFFASFPLFYSTSFGGAYWVWMLILFCFVVQAVSYEYRKKPENFLGKKTFEVFLFLNGLLGTVLIGTAVGTFFTGSDFFMAKENLTNPEAVTISGWANPWHGLEAALNIQNVLLGLAVFFLARVIAAQYFINHIDEDELLKRSKKQVLINTIPFLLTFLPFLGMLFMGQGFAYDRETYEVFMQDNKYWHNLVEIPLALPLFLIGVVLVLAGVFFALARERSRGAVWFTSIGAIMAVFVLFLLAGFNGTAFYPSTHDLQHSLTIENSSSSPFTLRVMSYVSLGVPFVVAYIWYLWSAMNKKPLNTADMEDEDDHQY